MDLPATQHISNEMRIASEEYKTWKKNTPFLYDVVMSHALEWPSLTAQWLPYVKSSDETTVTYRIILGTHTSDEMNHLLVVSVKMPKEDTRFPVDTWDANTFEFGGYGAIAGNFSVGFLVRLK